MSPARASNIFQAALLMIITGNSQVPSQIEAHPCNRPGLIVYVRVARKGPRRLVRLYVLTPLQHEPEKVWQTPLQPTTAQIRFISLTVRHDWYARPAPAVYLSYFQPS